MKNLFRLIIFGLIAALFAITFLTKSTAQKRPLPFSHNTRAHKEGKQKDCSSCHEITAKSWLTPRADGQESFPDVTNFPYKKHTACNACHVNDVFSYGAIFCGSCHVVPSMKATGGRGLLPFPVKSHPRQFNTIFPHDLHQNVIASNEKNPSVAVSHFIKASFAGRLTDEAQFNNCVICHKTRSQLPEFAPRVPAMMKPLGGEVANEPLVNFPPKASFFKDKPTGHASCFNCHFQGEKPAATNCAGCHKLTTPYFESVAVKRFSLKFDHQQEDHVNMDCMACHVRIAQNSDLKKMNGAEVPFMACVSCHSPHANDLGKELDSREQSIADKQPVFQCTYCHTSAVGRFPVPVSHQIR